MQKQKRPFWWGGEQIGGVTEAEGGVKEIGREMQAFKKAENWLNTTFRAYWHTETHSVFWTMASTTSVDVMPMGGRIFTTFPDIFFLPEFVSLWLHFTLFCIYHLAENLFERAQDTQLSLYHMEYMLRKVPMVTEKQCTV